MSIKRGHSKCQTCGLIFSNDALVNHELSCLARTQENSEIFRLLEVDSEGTSDKTANRGSSSDSFNEENDDDNISDDGVISDSEMFRLLETERAGSSDMTPHSSTSSYSFIEEVDDDNSSEEDDDNTSEDDYDNSSEEDDENTSEDDYDNSSEEDDGNSAEDDDDDNSSEEDDGNIADDDDDDKSSEDDDVSGSKMFEILKAVRSISLRGGGGSKPPNVGNNSGPSQKRRKSSLVTSTFRYDRHKPDNLFPPTKKYRYYPVTCEYCRKRFPPNKLKSHQRKHHSSEIEEVKPSRRVQSAPLSRKEEKKPSTRRSKSAGGIPRQLQVCYICGQLYGSTSLKIHEPKCLDKWRIQNQQLPPDLRAPEPVKPEPMASVGTGKEGYDVPEFDPKAESAFRSHLSTLIPCRHCSRTFSPDRIQKHMSCCIERTRTRECA